MRGRWANSNNYLNKKIGILCKLFEHVISTATGRINASVMLYETKNRFKSLKNSIKIHTSKDLAIRLAQELVESSHGWIETLETLSLMAESS